MSILSKSSGVMQRVVIRLCILEDSRIKRYICNEGAGLTKSQLHIALEAVSRDILGWPQYSYVSWNIRNVKKYRDL